MIFSAGVLTACYKPQPAPPAEPVPATPTAPTVVVQSPPAVVVEDDFVYYPDYEVYYSTNRHLFFYMDGGAWVTRPTFPGVSVDVLLASHAEPMNFHDSPANHHAEVTQRFPHAPQPNRRGP